MLKKVGDMRHYHMLNRLKNNKFNNAMRNFESPQMLSSKSHFSTFALVV